MEDRHAWFKLVPCKVSLDDRDSLDGEISKEQLLVSLKSMNNGKYLWIHDLLFELFKAMQDTIGDYICCMAKASFALGT